MRNKPNEWISIADLMTGVVGVVLLFFVMMAMLAHKIEANTSSKDRTATDREQSETDRRNKMSALMGEIRTATGDYQGVRVDTENAVIDFGDRARFATNDDKLTTEQQRLLRSFVSEILTVARGEDGSQWIKRIVIEGFTDKRGSYLYNLNLSLRRSQRVLCALLGPPAPGEQPMSQRDKDDVRRLFLVGGYSSNLSKASLDESRRIELSLEFYAIDENRTNYASTDNDPGQCAI